MRTILTHRKRWGTWQAFSFKEHVKFSLLVYFAANRAVGDSVSVRYIQSVLNLPYIDFYLSLNDLKKEGIIDWAGDRDEDTVIVFKKLPPAFAKMADQVSKSNSAGKP